VNGRQPGAVSGGTEREIETVRERRYTVHEYLRADGEERNLYYSNSRVREIRHYRGGTREYRFYPEGGAAVLKGEISGFCVQGGDRGFEVLVGGDGRIREGRSAFLRKLNRLIQDREEIEAGSGEPSRRLIPSEFDENVVAMAPLSLLNLRGGLDGGLLMRGSEVLLDSMTGFLVEYRSSGPGSDISLPGLKLETAKIRGYFLFDGSRNLLLQSFQHLEAQVRGRRDELSKVEQALWTYTEGEDGSSPEWALPSEISEPYDLTILPQSGVQNEVVSELLKKLSLLGSALHFDAALESSADAGEAVALQYGILHSSDLNRGAMLKVEEQSKLWDRGRSGPLVSDGIFSEGLLSQYVYRQRPPKLETWRRDGSERADMGYSNGRLYTLDEAEARGDQAEAGSADIFQRSADSETGVMGPYFELGKSVFYAELALGGGRFFDLRQMAERGYLTSDSLITGDMDAARKLKRKAMPPALKKGLLIGAGSAAAAGGIWFAATRAGVEEMSGGLRDVTVNNKNISFRFWDHGTPDGDQVDIYVNGSLVVSNHILRGAPGRSIPLTLNDGSNTVRIHADNEGTAPPNTATLYVSDVVDGPSEQIWSIGRGEEAVFHIRVNTELKKGGDRGQARSWLQLSAAGRAGRLQLQIRQDAPISNWSGRYSSGVLKSIPLQFSISAGRQAESRSVETYRAVQLRRPDISIAGGAAVLEYLQESRSMHYGKLFRRDELRRDLRLLYRGKLESDIRLFHRTAGEAGILGLETQTAWSRPLGRGMHWGMGLHTLFAEGLGSADFRSTYLSPSLHWSRSSRALQLEQRLIQHGKMAGLEYRSSGSLDIGRFGRIFCTAVSQKGYYIIQTGVDIKLGGRPGLSGPSSLRPQ